MKILNEFDKKYWNNEKIIINALIKYFIPILLINTIVFFLLFDEIIESKKLLKVILLFSMVIYSVIAIVKKLPYYAQREEYSKGYNNFIGYSVAVTIFFGFYLVTIITFGPKYPILKKLICCEHIKEWYIKENGKF